MGGEEEEEIIYRIQLPVSAPLAEQPNNWVTYLYTLVI